MRAKKNLVIGFLLLLLGIGLSEHSLLLSIFAGVAGIVMMILYAAGKLKRNTSETSAVSSKTSKIQPTTKTQQANAQSVSFSPEAQQLYQQLVDQYTQIVDNGCFGTLAQIAEKMDCCKHFLEQWMETLCNKRIPLLFTCNMGICIECDSYIFMSQYFCKHLHVSSVHQHKTCCGVTEIVQANGS